MYCIYLRKSRKDIEAEAHGAGETLKRHEEALLGLAEKLDKPISKVYREVVSGETIAARPVMRQLLREVEQNIWDGVFVMEVERLARGDTKDQGVVAEAFKYSETLIITPNKIYDPCDEFDEEYFEFGLFMSRREYKTINRRIQRGREASVKEGKWIYSEAPFGYRRIKLENQKGYTLKPDPAEAPTVRKIFDWYVNELIGSSQIAGRLNTIGIKPRRSDHWHPASVRDILSNVVYKGCIKKGERPEKRYMEDSIVKKRRVYNPQCLIVKGIHPPLVTEEQFDAAQRIKKRNAVTSNSGEKFDLRNPLAGLVECKICGRKLQLSGSRKNPKALRLHCGHCENISALYSDVESAVLAGLSDWLQNFKVSAEADNSPADISIYAEAISTAETELKTLCGQISRLHDLLEQGIYDTDTFLQRNEELADRKNAAQEKIDKLTENIAKIQRKENKEPFIPKVENVLDTYLTLDSAEKKNALLKSIIGKVSYIRTQKGTGTEKAFDIEIYPIIDYL